MSGYFIATLVARYGFGLELPYTEIWLILGTLTLINVVYLSISKIFKEFSFLAEIVFLQFHIIIDLIFLTALNANIQIRHLSPQHHSLEAAFIRMLQEKEMR